VKLRRATRPQINPFLCIRTSADIPIPVTQLDPTHLPFLESISKFLLPRPTTAGLGEATLHIGSSLHTDIRISNTYPGCPASNSRHSIHYAAEAQPSPSHTMPNQVTSRAMLKFAISSLRSFFIPFKATVSTEYIRVVGNHLAITVPISVPLKSSGSYSRGTPVWYSAGWGIRDGPSW
jgi:hypothetical protein